MNGPSLGETEAVGLWCTAEVPVQRPI